MVFVPRSSLDRSSLDSAALGRLTPADLEVLRLLAQGNRAAAVADHLGVPLASMRAQIGGILDALELDSQLEAVLLWRGRH